MKRINYQLFIFVFVLSVIACKKEVAPLSTAVDLGLSVKWASYNVGASKPEEKGDMFAWGETKPKEFYSWGNYRWCLGSKEEITKYPYYSPTVTMIRLESEDDAAVVNWQGSWRMPTRNEISELLQNTTQTWTTRNGIQGWLFTSKLKGYTDNSIFFPAGYYWSSVLEAGYRNYFASGRGMFENIDPEPRYRCLGCFIRPVTE